MIIYFRHWATLDHAPWLLLRQDAREAVQVAPEHHGSYGNACLLYTSDAADEHRDV